METERTDMQAYMVENVKLMAAEKAEREIMYKEEVYMDQYMAATAAERFQREKDDAFQGGQEWSARCTAGLQTDWYQVRQLQQTNA